MKAMVIDRIVSLMDSAEPLVLTEMATPSPSEGEVLIRITVCAVCHTELDEIEGRTPPPTYPMVPGHQVVGVVSETGKGIESLHVGDRVGVAWIFSSCGKCEYCSTGRENLCPQFVATGRDTNGGYAEYMIAKEQFVYRIPPQLGDSEAAPQLCAGAIGYRSLRLTGIQNGQSLGLTGFGASGHLVLKLVRYRYPDSRVYVFARSKKERQFALQLGAVWAGDTAEKAPELLDAIIDTTPAWKPVVEALAQLKPAGRLVINAIRKEHVDQEYLLHIDYPNHLWMEKEIKSVANVSRRDVAEFLELAAEIPIIPEYTEYPLDRANEALIAIKRGHVKGAKVLRIAN